MVSLAVCTLAWLAFPQGPDQVMARFELDGKPAVVTRDDVALEMAFHLRRKELGIQACKVLVDSTLTRFEAERLKLMPTDGEVRAFWQQLQDQLRAAGRNPEELPVVRNSTEAELLRDLSVQVAQERLVRKALALDANETVGGDMMQLWLTEHRKKIAVVTDPDQLPAGTAARIDGRDLPIADLGLYLLRTSQDSERDRFVRQVVYLTSIEHLGRKHGIDINQADLDRAIEERRGIAAADPRFAGLTLEQVLETQGLTVATLKQTRVFRAKVMQDLLTNALHPDKSLRAELADDRAAILADVGPRRHLGVVYRRALDQPNGLVPHDFTSAAESLMRVRKRLEKERFDLVARIETDDPRGKESGGDTGWHHRNSAILPAPVLEAAFAGEAGTLLGPVRAEDGCYLVKVIDVEPELDDAALLERLRRLRSDQLAHKILTDARIEFGPESRDQGPKK